MVPKACVPEVMNQFSSLVLGYVSDQRQLLTTSCEAAAEFKQLFEMRRSPGVYASSRQLRQQLMHAALCMSTPEVRLHGVSKLVIERLLINPIPAHAVYELR